jgi:hypothetical protein
MREPRATQSSRELVRFSKEPFLSQGNPGPPDVSHERNIPFFDISRRDAIAHRSLVFDSRTFVRKSRPMSTSKPAFTSLNMDINAKESKANIELDVGEIRPFGFYVPRRYVLAFLTFFALMFATIIRYPSPFSQIIYFAFLSPKPFTLSLVVPCVRERLSVHFSALIFPDLPSSLFKPRIPSFKYILSPYYPYFIIYERFQRIWALL